MHHGLRGDGRPWCFVTFVLHLYHSHLSHLTPYVFHIFITTFKMEDQRGIITIDIINLKISMIIIEEHRPSHLKIPGGPRMARAALSRRAVDRPNVGKLM